MMTQTPRELVRTVSEALAHYQAAKTPEALAEAAIMLYRVANQLASSVKDEVKTTLEAMMDEMGVDKIETPAGAAARVTQTRVTIKKAALDDPDLGPLLRERGFVSESKTTFLRIR